MLLFTGIETVSAAAVPHGQRFWAFTPSGGGDMEIYSLSNLQCRDA